MLIVPYSHVNLYQWAGASAGAAIGTAICPGVGTVIGGLIGGIGGGIGASSASRKVTSLFRRKRK